MIFLKHKFHSFSRNISNFKTYFFKNIFSFKIFS
nr:MAG TPA: hypothetical protein [Caudoviricetes sp.]